MIQPGVLRVLEFDRIVAAVQSFTSTPLGASKVEALLPATDAARVAQQLAATSESVTYAQAHGAFPLRAPADIDASLSALALQGRALEPARLRGLADFLDSVDQTRAALQPLAAEFPLLQGLSDRAASFKAQVTEVREKLSPSGDVLDSASPQLRQIRERLGKQRARLRGTLESYLRSKTTAKYLQERVVTERSGRLVLVVRAEHRSAIPGIIHGSSGSGASLYLEPLSTVEINNDIVALDEQEAAEVHRILLALTNGFRARPLDLQRSVDVAIELDILQAKASFSSLIGGVAPALAEEDRRFELREARHPLLMPSVLERLGEAVTGREPPVPVDLLMIPPVHVLLVTGPNTGGKTVSLKTAGLLALMAQAGLHVPAALAMLPVFRSVFADIGDEQSLSASLSTFSGHITNIVSMERALLHPSLVLLDEIGAGTDPGEGGALGVAIIDHFRRTGAMVMSTTHYDALKSYAMTTDGVTSAACGFDPETFAPTYRLVYGSPGRSLALEVAARLGLNPAIVGAARQNVSAERARVEDQLTRMDRELQALERDRAAFDQQRQAFEATTQELQSREASLREREAVSTGKLNKALNDRLREARAEIDTVLAEVRQQADAWKGAARQTGTAPSTGETGALRSGARTRLEQVAEQALPEAEGTESADARPPGDAPVARPALVGDRVRIGGLGLEGTVLSIHHQAVEVEVQGKRLRSTVSECEVLGSARTSEPRSRVSVELAPHESSSELNLIGSTVDEAVTRVEKFLDETLLSDLRVVRLIHGHGTGQLRRALAEYLASHPLVVQIRAADPAEGGGGVTVVELKD